MTWARRGSTQGFLPLETIGPDWMRVRGGGLRAVLECPTLAFGLKGEAEQRAVIDGWASLLNSLSHPLQVTIRSRRLDPVVLALPQAKCGDARDELRAPYSRLVEELAGQRRLLDRRSYVVVPFERPARQPGAGEAEDAAAIAQRARGSRSRWISAPCGANRDRGN